MLDLSQGHKYTEQATEEQVPVKIKKNCIKLLDVSDQFQFMLVGVDSFAHKQLSSSVYKDASQLVAKLIKRKFSCKLASSTANMCMIARFD